MTIIYKNDNVIRSDVYKNLKYISLLRSRATLAEPSKMHRNRPLAVHPATLLNSIKRLLARYIQSI